MEGAVGATGRRGTKDEGKMFGVLRQDRPQRCEGGVVAPRRDGWYDLRDLVRLPDLRVLKVTVEDDLRSKPRWPWRVTQHRMTKARMAWLKLR